ncbi:MAG TPA: FkbM family methyltransferase [Pyrinomonadaceae bacterium]|nr:FkbM family methyltransferase [Pyrinomonadaceae bacterium]
MKELFRKNLGQSRYERLARLKGLILNPGRAPATVTRWLVRRHAAPRVMLDVKNSINLVERMDYERGDIFLNVDSECEFSLRTNSCKKEPDTVNWIETFIKEGDVLFDIGANVGAYSLVAAKFFNGKVKVYAFEPAIFNFSQLCRNIQLNKSQDTIVPLALALSDETTIGQFNYHNQIPGGSLHTFGKAIDHVGNVFEPEYVQPMLSFRIDDLIEQFKVPVPNHIKIDVDGIELSVLRGADRTLANPVVRSVLVELEQGESEQAITAFLQSKGFKLNSKYTRLTPGMLNCIFLREHVK